MRAGGRDRDTGRPARVANLALVPASLVPHRARYQRLADRLPAGAVLVVLPDEDSPERRTLQETAARLRAKGHAIAVVSVDQVLGRRRPRIAPAPAAADPPPAGPQPSPAAGRSAPADPRSAADEAPVPPFTRELRLVRVDAGTAPARAEVWRWQPTLWGGAALVRLHGALGQPPRTQVVLEADAPTADAARERLARRLRAGYRVVDWA